MNSITLSLSEYQSGLARGSFSPPGSLCPYFDVDPVLFRSHAATDQRRGDIRRAMEELRKRTGQEYFGKTYPLQARTLDYSARSFPAYRFILPEVMTEDWLAVVDWGKFQRDHVLHQPLCGYVALRLLDGYGSSEPLQLPDGRTLLDACVDHILRWDETAYIKDFLIDCGMAEDERIFDARNPVARQLWRILFRESTYVAAVFHDLGYPWQYAERLQKNIDEINTPAVRTNRNVAQIIEIFERRLVFRPFHGYQAPDMACPSTWHDRVAALVDLALSNTHGLPGALGFLHLNDCVRKYPSSDESALRLLCVEWAAAAILMHDMCGIYWGSSEFGSDPPENPFLRLSFKRDPLSAIVTLVDVVQDFERPMARFDVCNCGRSSAVSLKYDTGCHSTALELAGRDLKISYRMTNRQSLAFKRRCLSNERIKYFDYAHGYLDMSSLGIENVQLAAYI
jgi:hypothetical protein